MAITKKCGDILKLWKKILLILLAVENFFLILALCINGYMVQSTKARILSLEEAVKLPNTDCILVLGCGVRPDGTPSAMLADRLKQAIALYNSKAAPKLLMSGDHGQKSYDEVNTMKQYALNAGVPSADIFMDHAGFSTYESIYRARDIFEAKKMIIVTQKYHLPRALHIAKAFGLEAYGVSADLRSYGGQTFRDIREILARNKDFVTSIIQPKPTYLGETIPVWGDGNLTNG
jgi:vancomycin permeability regulator SanA